MRLVYLDSVIVIYAVEAPSGFGTRAQAHLADLRRAGDTLAVTDLTWLECQVKPLRLNDAALLTAYHKFLTAPDVVQLRLPTAVYARAARIRARHGYKLADSLHLAASVEAGCDAFLTNDHRLSSFPDIAVEVLP